MEEFHQCENVDECFNRIRNYDEPYAYMPIEREAPFQRRFMKYCDAYFDFENVERIVAFRTTFPDLSIFTKECPLRGDVFSNWEEYKVVLKDPSKPFRAVGVFTPNRGMSMAWPEGYKDVGGFVFGPEWSLTPNGTYASAAAASNEWFDI